MKARIAALLLAFSLTGCSFSLPLMGPSEEVRYYVLTSPKPKQRSMHETRIGVLPVSLPGYLSRPQLVVRDKDSVNINIRDFDRWGEELSRGVSRVLCNTLATQGYCAVPLRTGSQVDSKLMLDVRRLDGSLNGEVTLDAVWTLQKNKAILASGQVVASRPAGNTLEKMVEAQSLLIQDMARDIAENLTNTKNPK
ncbi:MAG: membrane integrity-associated transporter subunit PqiC [Mailhella sp.]|nr:membrane integrity-associated transporter subunit PqiC [Mailhella sp.]